MGKITDFIKKISGKEEEEEYVAKPVVDRYLDSLRRERQVQTNELEKEELKKAIKTYKLEKERKYLWGLKDGAKEEKKRQLKEALRKKRKVEVLAQKRKLLEKDSLLDNKKEEFKKKKYNILKNHGRFI